MQPFRGRFFFFLFFREDRAFIDVSVGVQALPLSAVQLNCICGRVAAFLLRGPPSLLSVGAHYESSSAARGVEAAWAEEASFKYLANQ